MKKNIGNLIKGWLPIEQKMPTQALHQSTLKTEVRPLFTGLGVGLVVLGVGFCFFSSYHIDGNLPVDIVLNVISQYLVGIAVGCAFLVLGIVLVVFGMKKSQNPNSARARYFLSKDNTAHTQGAESMTLKGKLESRIRGWFPSTPISPTHNRALIQNTMPLASPLPPTLESKYQRWVGVFIGLGLGMFIIGVGGALFTNTTYNTVLNLLSFQGLSTDYYLLRELIQQTAFFLMLAAGGVFSMLLSIVGLRSNTMRRATLDKEHNRLGNFLFGFGDGLIMLSFRPLFIYFLAPNDATLNHDFIQLKIFAGLLIVGVVLAIAGFMSWRRRK